MRNITAAPDSLLAYHKLLPRFTTDILSKINILYRFSAQEFGAFTGLLLSEYPDCFSVAES
jgi:hypothetical protein